MDFTTLMARFADPETLQALTVAEKLVAGLITTFLGMGITFIALGILQLVIELLARLCRSTAPAVQPGVRPQQPAAALDSAAEQRSNEKLVAAITVALALHLGTTASRIVIRNIRRVEDHSPAWNKTGLAELMNINP